MSPRALNEQDQETREQRILDVALDIMQSETVAGLTIDKVTARVPFSKGTIYNHFTCKEDMITGVCNLSMQLLDDLFARALTFAGNGRERMLAQHYAYLLYARLHPVRFLLVVSAKTPAVMEKTSERRLEQLRALDESIFGKVLTVVEQAIREGDLILPDHLDPRQVTFANWASSFGTISLLHGHYGDTTCRDGLQLERELFNNINIVLDGLNWRPLSSDSNYRQTIARIEKELFAEELQSVATLNHQPGVLSS